jgi:hypothetical protein
MNLDKDSTTNSCMTRTGNFVDKVGHIKDVKNDILYQKLLMIERI